VRRAPGDKGVSSGLEVDHRKLVAAIEAIGAMSYKLSSAPLPPRVAKELSSMPFAVELPGGTNEREFEEQVRLLRTWGIHVAQSPRIAEPGTENRWLHAWQSRSDAQRFADELKAITANPGWVVYELQSPVCPNCHIGLDERQLVPATWTVACCPNCRAVVRREENGQDRDAMAREDVAAIEDWLGPLAREAASRGQSFRVTPMAEGLRQGKHLWGIAWPEVANSSLPLSCTVEYCVGTPRIFEVRLTSTHGGQVVLKNLSVLSAVCAEHGTQPHTCEQRSSVVWEGERVEVRWGAHQLLATAPLTVALFETVAKRLDRAMQDVGKRLGLEGMARVTLDWVVPGPVPAR
jgi:hypothetical protein